MKVLVLNGSPKGPLSATLYYVLFLQRRFPEHEFEILHVCQECERIEHDEATFRGILEKIRAADGVLWAFPVYNFLVHAHYKRFIELVFERGAEDAFRDKYAAALSTSIHFFDYTAHDYVQAICEDWGMRYVGSFSASVYDLLKAEEKARLVLFGRGFFAAMAGWLPMPRVHPPVRHHAWSYVPSAAQRQWSLPGKRMLILSDCEEQDANCDRMIQRFCACFAQPPEVINLRQAAIRHACDGCFECGAEGLCVFRDADDVHDIYVSKVAPAEILVMAGSIRDRYLSSRWKLFLDRGFFRPVIPWFPGKQVAVLISGPLQQLANLRLILEGYVEFHQGHLVGIATDECADSAGLDRTIDALAERVAFCAESGYARPRTFLGVGGTRIFRDATWGFLRPVFQVAHRYYLRHGIYDFPQYDFQSKMVTIGGMVLTKLPWFRRRFFKKLKTQMIQCLQRELDKEDERG